ncbi:F-box only protein 8-like [Coffea arabica]|uniref:F-box only protein 8-like n=1 Tax=Coffea arabica TaxID=13443 RepID=A0A6P6V8B7_COFAR|nr:F-box only protein 8-like [Coffea arabica]
MKPTKRKNIVPIPKDILLEIFVKLPAKRLLRFKCVSKHWCSIIEGSELVDAFRNRPCNRGTNLLVRRKCTQEEETIEGRRKFNDFFLLDSEGKCVPLEVPVILQEKFFSNDDGEWQHVEGLVHRKNIIWNPTTRKVVHLPPRNPFWDASKVIENMGIVAGCDNWSVSSKYFLGFDVSIKKHKVLCICRMDFRMNTISDGYIENSDIQKSQVSIEVLTLGANCWKKTTSDYPLPKELFEDFHVKTYCSINGVIYMIICPPCKRFQLPRRRSDQNDTILAYDITHEKFQLLPLPRGIGGIVHFVGDLRGRLTLMQQKHKQIWILEEDYGGPRWTVVDLLLPELWYTREISLREKIVKPIGLNPSGEIFFEVKEFSLNIKESSLSTIYVYNMESKDTRKVRFLTRMKNFFGSIFPNLVATIQPLK